MIRISPLLLLILLSFTDHVGSLNLTSSPLTATNGEPFTLICRSYTAGGRDRQWYVHDKIVFTTTRDSFRISVSNPNVFSQRHLLGRVNVSCDALQHNVTLRINSVIDDGSRWHCLDYGVGQQSSTLTINVTDLQTTLATTSTRSTVVTTAATTHISLSGLTGDAVSQGSTSPKSTQSTQTTTSGTTTKGTPISTYGETGSSVQDNTIANAAGAAGGGVAIIAVVIVVVVCIRKRRCSVEEDVKGTPRRERIPSRSAEMLIESGVTEDEEIVMQDIVIYSSSSDVAPADYRIQDHNPVVTDVYAKVKKPADQHVVTDVYAKPNKVGKETCNTDVYTKVNKLKKTASDQPKDTSENIEDMYAKPQKNKQNQQNKTPRLD